MLERSYPSEAGCYAELSRSSSFPHTWAAKETGEVLHLPRGCRAKLSKSGRKEGSDARRRSWFYVVQETRERGQTASLEKGTSITGQASDQLGQGLYAMMMVALIFEAFRVKRQKALQLWGCVAELPGPSGPSEEVGVDDHAQRAGRYRRWTRVSRR